VNASKEKILTVAIRRIPIAPSLLGVVVAPSCGESNDRTPSRGEITGVIPENVIAFATDDPTSKAAITETSGTFAASLPGMTVTTFVGQ